MIQEYLVKLVFAILGFLGGHFLGWGTLWLSSKLPGPKYSHNDPLIQEIEADMARRRECWKQRQRDHQE